MKDYYQILGISPNADIATIKTCFRKLSHKFHPDKNENDKYFEERFIEIKEAYDILSDTEQRRIYDIKYKNKDKSYQSQNYFEPQIVNFTINKNSIIKGEEIVIEWKVINSDFIFISLIGFQNNNYGKVSYQINKLPEENTLKIYIEAKNSFINKTVKKTILLENTEYVNQEKEKERKREEESERLKKAETAKLKEIERIKKIALENEKIKAKEKQIKTDKAKILKYELQQAIDNTSYLLGWILLGFIIIFFPYDIFSSKDVPIKTQIPLLTQLDTNDKLHNEINKKLNNLLHFISDTFTLYPYTDFFSSGNLEFFDAKYLNKSDLINIVNHTKALTKNKFINFKINSKTKTITRIDNSTVTASIEVKFKFVKTKINLTKRLFVKFNEELKIFSVTDNLTSNKISDNDNLLLKTKEEPNDNTITLNEYILDNKNIQFIIKDNFDCNIPSNTSLVIGINQRNNLQVFLYKFDEIENAYKLNEEKSYQFSQDQRYVYYPTMDLFNIINKPVINKLSLSLSEMLRDLPHN